LTYEDSQERPARWVGLLPAALLPVLIVAVTVLLRLINLTTSYDLFIDEPFYVAVGQSVAQGHMPQANGSLFFLHPPGYSILEAIWIHVVGGVSGSVIDQVATMRYLNMVFAGITGLLLYLIGRRLAGPAAGVGAAAFFAVSPWFIRQNSFVLLETSALAFVLAGYLGLLCLPSARGRRRLALVLIGLAFGYGVLIKELAVFVTILPTVLIGWRGAGRAHRNGGAQPPPPPVIGRGEAGLVVAATTLPYVIWCLVIAATGELAEFWAQTWSGLSRASGVQQISGFNMAGTPSLLTTILANTPAFWTTYLLMGTGAVLSIYLVLQPTPSLRVLGAFGFGSLPLLGYSAIFGANEEQFYYYLLVPSALAVAVCVQRSWARIKPMAKGALMVLAVVWACSDLANWTIVHTNPDNQAQQVDDWMRANVPDGATVAVTDAVQREIFLRYRMVNDDSQTALDVPGGVRYLVVTQKKVNQGYAFIGPERLAEQVRGRKPIFTTGGREGGSIDVYDLG
jgi:4-amino-4-deoxy-L-arabinose transferase-like glycosyltransferase